MKPTLLFSCAWLLLWLGLVLTATSPAPATAQAQPTFASAQLEKLYQRLALERATVVRDVPVGEDAALRMRVLRTVYRGRLLTVKMHVSARRHVSHIGFAFFEPEETEQLGLVALFLERQFLHYHTKDVAARIASMRIDQVRVTHNGVPYGDLGFTRFDAVTGVIRGRTSFGMTMQTSDDLPTYRFTCLDTDGNRLTVTFPARYDLMTGLDKVELEEALAETLRTLPSSAEAPSAWPKRDGNALTPYADALYQTTSKEFFPGLRSTVFFTQRGPALFPVRDALYPLESLNNLFARPVATDSVTLDVTYRRYGFQQESVRVDLASLMHHFSRDYEIYVGFEGLTDGGHDASILAAKDAPMPEMVNRAVDHSEAGAAAGAAAMPDTVRALLIFAHRDFAHLHLMTIDWPRVWLLENKPRLAQAILYAYIRRDNINTLFAPYEERHDKRFPVYLDR